MNLTKVLLVSFFILIGASVFGQRYTNSFGLKAGNGYFLSYKHHVNETLGFDAYTGNDGNSKFTIGLSLHIQYPNDFLDDQLNVYYGAGAMTIFKNNTANFGFVGVGGLEYILKGAPISFSLEFTPGLLFGPGGGFSTVGSGFVFRYIINE